MSYSKVKFRGVAKKVLADIAREVMNGLNEKVKKKRKWRLREPVKNMLKYQTEAVATIVISTASFVLTNIDNIETLQLEGLAKDGRIISESVKEAMKAEDTRYIA